MKIIRLMVALATLMAVPALSLASPLQPFDARAFDTLTASGKRVVVAVHASWCPTCKAQIPTQTELMQSPEFKDYTMFIVDFDKDTDVLKRFHVAVFLIMAIGIVSGADRQLESWLVDHSPAWLTGLTTRY